MKTVRMVRDFAIIAGCYVVTGISAWLLGKNVAGPAIGRLINGESDE